MILRLLIWLVVQVSLVVKCKKLDLVERRINVQEFQKPIPEEYRPVQFKEWLLDARIRKCLLLGDEYCFTKVMLGLLPE